MQFLSDGLMVVDHNCAVGWVDEVAASILHSDLGIAVSGGHLRWSGRRSLLNDEAFSTFLSHNETSTKKRLFLRSNDDQVLVLSRYTCPFELGGHGDDKNFLIRISVLYLSSEIDEEGITQLYGLTAAESSVVSALAARANATLAASELGLSRETVKSHLRNIYGKTGTVSIGQLMLLIGKLSAP